MKSWKRGVATVAAATLCLTSIPFGDVWQVSAAEVDSVVKPDSVVKLKPSEASPFNDTNGDGLGEFEGWGTSLCWWANRIGYSDKLTQEAGKLFFSDSGLDMNIGRYNVGGGDHVGKVEITEVPVNNKAQFYDLETEGRIPEYHGTKMQVEECTDMASVTFEYSDADFGFTKGMPVGSFKKIGWINKIGDTPGEGDNLRYKVQTSEAGNYTVKLLLTLTGSNQRDVVLGVGEKEYLVSADVINSNMIASGNNNMLFVVTIPNVELQAGENEVVIAGKADWTLDFVKMAVMKSGDEGVLTETEDEFLHEPHIIRSDAGVPGYAIDVTKIDTSQHELSWYEENFARADVECGYAWNYNWDADKNQINVLKAAAEASGQDFIAEAFSNSPPYFMTVSGCSSGNTDSNKDNLRADSVNAFAAYMADVIEHWQNNGITFQSASPMNEPYTNYWGANSNKQEGCHFDQGESQSRIILALNNALKEKGIDLIISATDETSIDTQITSYNALSEEAKSVVSRIDTHTYSGSNREGLKTTAQEAGENLWMSEVDGAYTAGTNAGEMSAALGLAQRMMTDVNGLDSTAWILWNAIDMHADSSEYGQSWVNKGSDNDYLSMDALEKAWQSRSSNGYWGLAAADHDNQNIVLSMKYYGYGQFSRYIRPGYTIIGSSKGTTLAAYDPNGKKAVIVAVNTSENDKNWKFDLSGFETMGDKITAIRTSGTMAEGEKWANVTASDNIVADTENRYFTASMKGNSITTYIVEGVSGIREATEADKPEVKQIPVTAEQVSGEKVWNNGTVNTPAKVVDNNYETFFDGVDTDNGEAGYIVIDLGEAKEIAALGYAPRNGFADRCIEGTFYGSADGTNWTTLYTIEEAPRENTDTIVYFSDFLTGKAEKFRYVKYAREKECNVSELKVYEAVPAGVSITSENFPDETFRKYVSDKIDKDKDGKLSDAEIAAVTEIKVHETSVKDLTGVEYFTALKTLSCYNTEISKLDLTHNVALETLHCYKTAITSLDVTHNPKLVLLSAYETGIDSIDLSQNPELAKVYLDKTNLTQIDTSKNPKLEILDLDDTKLTYLDVSQNTALIRVDCSNTPLYGLNVGNNKKLMTVNKTNSKINLTVPAESFDLKEYFPLMDMSKVKVISGAELNGSVLSGYTEETPVVYEYNAGEDKKGKDVILNVTLTLDVETSEVPPTVINHIPVITANDVTIKVGDKFNPMAGVTAKDTEDGDLTEKVTYEGKVDTEAAGSYEVTYKVSDKEGATAIKKITVTVEAVAVDKVEAFVSRLYTQLLGREADADGLESWTEVLKSHKEQGAKVAQGFVESPEFKKRNLSDKEYISILYRTFLDREADAKGLAAWQKVLDDGLSRMHVFKGFAESSEFTEICSEYSIIRGNVVLTAPMDQNEGVTKFVARCYKFCLGRKGDEEGINAWCNQILTGKNTAKQVAHGFIFSDEFKKKNLSDEEYVKTLYRVLMDREADKAGLASWVKVLENGESREHVFNGFADSNEFKKICDRYGIK